MTDVGQLDPQNWLCHVCGNVNYSNRQQCNMRVCQAMRGTPGPYAEVPEGVVMPKGGNSHGNTSTGNNTTPSNSGASGSSSASNPPHHHQQQQHGPGIHQTANSGSSTSSMDNGCGGAGSQPTH